MDTRSRPLRWQPSGRRRGLGAHALALVIVGALVALLSVANGPADTAAAATARALTAASRHAPSHPATSDHGSWWAGHSTGGTTAANDATTPRHKRGVPARSVHRVKIKLHKAIRKARSRLRVKNRQASDRGTDPALVATVSQALRRGMADGRALGQRDRRSLTQVVMGPVLSRDPPSNGLATLL